MSQALAADSLLSHYKLIRLLGQGGMGQVWLAHDMNIGNRPVAIKVMLPEVARYEHHRERFKREAEAAATILPAHRIITIYYVGEYDGIPFIVMELLYGTDLQKVLETSPIPDFSFTLRVVRQVLEGLDAAHSMGLMHRDIKPQNLWLEIDRPRGTSRSQAAPPTGAEVLERSRTELRVRILDFGLARQVEGDLLSNQTGGLVGTYYFLSPEQSLGRNVDHRTDLWAVGVMLYLMITGRYPFDGRIETEILMKINGKNPMPPRRMNPQIPESLEMLVLEMLAKKKEQRPADAVAIISRIDAILGELQGTPVEPVSFGTIAGGASSAQLRVPDSAPKPPPGTSPSKPAQVETKSPAKTSTPDPVVPGVESSAQLRVPDSAPKPPPGTNPAIKQPPGSNPSKPAQAETKSPAKTTAPDQVVDVELLRRLHREQKEKEDAAKRSTEEAARKQAEEAAKKSSEIAKRQAEEAARKQAEEAARIQAEQSRRNAEEAAKKAAETVRRAETKHLPREHTILPAALQSEARLKATESRRPPEPEAQAEAEARRRKTELLQSKAKTKVVEPEAVEEEEEVIVPARKVPWALVGGGVVAVVVLIGVIVVLKGSGIPAETSIKEVVTGPKPENKGRPVELVKTSTTLPETRNEEKEMLARMKQSISMLSKGIADTRQNLTERQQMLGVLSTYIASVQEPPKPLVPVRKEVVPPKIGDVREVEIAMDVKMKFCWVPPGEAQLGSPDDEQDYVAKTYFDDQRPKWLDTEKESLRKKYTSNGFWLAKYDVTQGEWRAVMDSLPSFSLGDRLPVEQVNWYDAAEFCNKVSHKLGLSARYDLLGIKRNSSGLITEAVIKINEASKGVRLPHEDEWEYACRGGRGNKQAFYFGNILDGDKANCDGNFPYGTKTTRPDRYLQKTSVVGQYESKAPHPWGLCDMHGNVWQWCENLYGSDEKSRVLRGGSWYRDAWTCRAARREESTPSGRYKYFGFRILLPE